MSISITPGSANPSLPDAGRRLVKLELLLQGFDRTKGVVKLDGQGPTRGDLLLKNEGIDTSGIKPFEALAIGSQLYIGPGMLTRHDTGTEITISGHSKTVAKEFGAKAGNIIYLVAQVDPKNYNTITRVSLTVGSPWPRYPLRATFAATAPYAQGSAFVELGRVVSAPGGGLAVEHPWTSGNVMLARGLYQGRLVWNFVAGN